VALRFWRFSIADRLEVWNPGSLPGTLELDDLRHDHASVPNNPLIAEPLYLARYIERAGSGTQTMIELCKKAGLPEPSFEQRSGFFVTTLWRDWLTDRALAGLNLNERQRKAVAQVKMQGQITNADYRKIAGAIRKTAARDLDELVSKRVLRKVEITGRGTHYVLAGKRDINGTNGTSGRSPSKGAKAL